MKHITKTILLLVFLNLSCKNTNENLSKTDVNITNLNIPDTTTEIKNNTIKISKDNKNNNKLQKWVFHKAAPFSDLFTCDEVKYKNFAFSISGDSIFIDGKFTDEIYRKTKKAEEVLKPKTELDLYKTFLPKNFNVNLPATLENITNKNAYKKDSKLDAYFQDAFFIDQYLFFNNNGCLYCFKKEEKSSQTVAESCFDVSTEKLPYNNTINPKSVQYNVLKCQISGAEKYLCGEKYLRYLSLPSYKQVKLILVPLDCGDFEYRFYLLTILNNKVVSNQYVEGEWYEPEANSKKEITSFSIDKNYKIKITTNIVENGKTSLKEKLNFEISEGGILNKI